MADELNREKLTWMYVTMVRHRAFENQLLELYEDGFVPGHIHLSQGQEAISVGAIAAMRPDDYFTSNHRGHGHLIARGEKPERMMAELLGKSTGLMKGKGGSMHLANLDFGDLGADGVLGTGLVIAPGAALAAKLRGTDRVTLCFFGDGCINTARFHEGINLASALKLSVVFICENNTWAEATSIYYSTNLTKVTDRAVGYGIPGIAVDGNDVLAVYEVVTEAIERARNGDGPTFIECKTCRQRGHFEGELQTYRAEGEIEECKRKDPIPRFKKKLIEMGVLTEEEADRIEQEALDEMAQVVKFAKESPFPDPEETFTDVYV